MNPVLPPRFLGMSPAAAVIVFLTLATLGRLLYCVWLPILPDETYYFLWSRHLDASYFSKGPAIAYTIATGTALWGNNVFGVRFFAVLLSAGTGWQVFSLARLWFGEVTGLIAVLIVAAVPIYALGAILMTIDPLSAFFWIWAANLFSKAVRGDRLIDWLLAGFAVGSGFLAKYVNALELVGFLAFLATIPQRRRLLAGAGFWSMLAVAIFCTLPVLWWNHQHHWVSAGALADRGKLNGPFEIHPSMFLDFLALQSLVLSPLLLLALLASAVLAVLKRREGNALEREGELLMLFLFLPVFLMYAVLAWHLRCEPNWPVISYLTLTVLLAAQWRRALQKPGKHVFIVATFIFACLETAFLQTSHLLPLSAHQDPMSRSVGWSEVAQRLDTLRAQQHVDVLIADGYKEASILSFLLPGKPFVYTLRHSPPASQFDLWPTFPDEPGSRAIWVTAHQSLDYLKGTADMPNFTLLEQMVISYRGEKLRTYNVYLCEHPAP